MDNSLIEYLLSRAKRGVTADGMNPIFVQRLQSAINDAEAATGSKATVTDLYRDPTRQAQYYANYKQRPVDYGGRTYNPQHPGGLAAAPGRSRHQVGQAADISRGPVLDWLHHNANNYGLEFLPGKAFKRDPVHIQLARGWQGDLPQGAAQMAAAAPPNPAQVNATPQTPPPDPAVQAQQAPDPAALQAAQTAQLAQAQAAQAAPAQQAAQQPVDPVRSFFDRLLTPKARPAGQSPGMLSQMAENAGAPSGTVGLLGKLLMGAGTALGGDSAPPLQAEDTAANVPREDTAQAMQRGQMAQAMLQPNASQQGPSQPDSAPADLAQLTPEQIEELRRKGLLGQFGLA